ncbi:hypothetical protein Micbo1qcDRAFT_49172 [Microdochium bolleyi]|uniref:Uncharacterized protein n=1 Tax=Microdochium bolleyi TaxID=196109 RepID=A0A136IKB5_9PEZI|nr:hypothetical protein Micbo1qcDRAFT_49172 [Microdochium bolleyi]
MGIQPHLAERSHPKQLTLKLWSRRQSKAKHLSMGSIVRFSLYTTAQRLQSIHEQSDEKLLQDYSKDGFVDDLLRLLRLIECPKDRIYALLEGGLYAAGNDPCFEMGPVHNTDDTASRDKKIRRAFWLRTCDMQVKQLRLIFGDSEDTPEDGAAKDRGSLNEDGLVHKQVLREWTRACSRTSLSSSTILARVKP